MVATTWRRGRHSVATWSALRDSAVGTTIIYVLRYHIRRRDVVYSAYVTGKTHKMRYARDINSSGAKKFDETKDAYSLIELAREYKDVYECVTGVWTEFYDIDWYGPHDNVLDLEHKVCNEFVDMRQKMSECKVIIKTCSTPIKLSIHFIVRSNIAFANHESMRSMYQIVSARFKYGSYMDGGIYTRNRLIRCTYSQKCNDGRYFRTLDDPVLTVVSHITADTIVGSEVTNSLSLVGSLSRIDTLQIYRKLVTLGLPDDFEARNVVGTLIHLKRLRSGECIVCKRIHDRENSWADAERLIVGCYRNKIKRWFANKLCSAITMSGKRCKRVPTIGTLCRIHAF